jgi:hypothetical protein
VRWRERVIGIVLGLILGIGIVTAFVFMYSEDTVDAPSISRSRADREDAGADRMPAAEPPVETVKVINGAPPPAGPAQLQFRPGEVARLRVVSDATVALELVGYGIARTVQAGTPELIRFKASQRGNFPLVVAPSRIGIAEIRVGGPPA